jgi:hypothetical protein
MDLLQSQSEKSFSHEDDLDLQSEKFRHFYTGLYISYFYLILDNVLSQTLPTLWPNGKFKVSFSPEEALQGWDKSA